MKMLPLPSREYLNKCFTYDPLTGDLFWKERPELHFRTKRIWMVFNGQYAGTKAGCKHYQSYGAPRAIVVKINRIAFQAHRIACVIMGVDIPEGMEVDHKNTDPFDNAWTNLRLATKAQNVRNRGLNKNKRLPLPKGVTVTGNTFGSQIVFENKHIHLGKFKTAEEAHAAYCLKAKELFGEFARFN